jgi:ABC-type transport system substrate-binding protein
VDLEERREYVHEAQQIIMEQALVMPLTIDINVVAMNPEVKDLTFGPSGFYDVNFYDVYIEEE